MKKGKIPFLFSLIPCISCLASCFVLRNIIDDTTETSIPTIDVVNYLKINLQGNTEKKLNPVLSDGSNGTFIYKSSNESVATVSSSGVVKGLKVGSATITVTLQSHSNVSAAIQLEIIDEAITNYDYTLMYYMSGSDLEFKSDSAKANEQGFISRDIKEILSVNNIPDTVKIIIQTGGTKKWSLESSYIEGSISSISSDHLQRWEVVNNKLRLIDTLSTNYMAKSSSLESFLNWGLDDYQATQMGLIFSGHGSGIGGCGFDDNYTSKWGDEDFSRPLRTFEIAQACETALANSPKDKFTWIGYDCCVMQCADIATINAKYFDYMVASQDLENATGWDHDSYITKIRNNPRISAPVLLQEICDSFVAENHSDSELKEEACYQCLSVLDLSKVQPLINSFETMTTELGLGLMAYKRAEVAFKNCYNFYGDRIYGLADFKNYVSVLKSSYGLTTADSVLEAMNDVVLYKKSCNKFSIDPCGMNAFFPLSMDSKYILQVGKEDYANSLSTNFKKWQSLCVNYGTFGWESI